MVPCTRLTCLTWWWCGSSLNLISTACCQTVLPCLTSLICEVHPGGLCRILLPLYCTTGRKTGLTASLPWLGYMRGSAPCCHGLITLVCDMTKTFLPVVCLKRRASLNLGVTVTCCERIAILECQRNSELQFSNHCLRIWRQYWLSLILLMLTSGQCSFGSGGIWPLKELS